MAETTAARADPPARRRDGPDFFCVGLMKGGTSWLFDQLQHHPDFWMTPYKELHYFDREFPGGRIQAAASQLLTDPDAAASWRAGEQYRPLDMARDAPFFEKIAAFEAPQKDFDAYAALFEPAGDLITGDVTPGYSVLKSGIVKKLAERFPDAKVVMVLREPAARLWSQWSVRNLRRKESEAQGLDLETFRWWSQKDDVAQRSYPTRIARRWRRHFGERFRYYFLDDVIADPDGTRAKILDFLGARTAFPSVLEAGFNRKENMTSLKRSPEIQAYMKEIFEEERRLCAKTFRGAALKWPDLPY